MCELMRHDRSASRVKPRNLLMTPLDESSASRARSPTAVINMQLDP